MHTPCFSDCSQTYPLGIDEDIVKDFQFSSSAYYRSSTQSNPPYRARFNFDETVGTETPYWDPGGLGEWLQVDLLVSHVITEIELRGDPNTVDAVETFVLHYSDDGSTWTMYEYTNSTSQQATVSKNTKGYTL